MNRYRIVHVTRYRYEGEVESCYNEAHLRPRATPTQVVHRSSLEIDPLPTTLSDRTDMHGNPTTFIAVQEPFTAMMVTATSEVSVEVGMAGAPEGTPAWNDVAARLRRPADDAAFTAAEYRFASPHIGDDDPGVSAYAALSFPVGRPLAEAVDHLMRRINTEFTYDPGFTSTATPLAEVLAARRGVCQDFAHLAIGCLRSQGLAARYVSGYLETDPPPGRERLVGADASHAWFAVWSPTHGWFDVDPTNAHYPSGRHVTLAWGRDFTDVTPLKGVLYSTEGTSGTLDVSVDVARMPEPVPDSAAEPLPFG